MECHLKGIIFILVTFFSLFTFFYSDPDFSSESMRLKALNAILKLSKTGDDCLSICLKFSQSLIAVDKNCRKRYFNDSVIHRVKHKKLQLLLIIETIAFQRLSSSNSNLVSSVSFKLAFPL